MVAVPVPVPMTMYPLGAESERSVVRVPLSLRVDRTNSTAPRRPRHCEKNDPQIGHVKRAGWACKRLGRHLSETLLDLCIARRSRVH